MSLFKYDYVEPEKIEKRDGPYFSEGRAQFAIQSADNHVSKEGKPSVKLVLQVRDMMGKEGTLYDYVAPIAWKVMQVLKGIGKEHLYSPDGFDTNQLVGGRGDIEIKNSYQQGFGEQSKISFYYEKMVAPDAAVHESSFKGDTIEDDEIPF